MGRGDRARGAIRIRTLSLCLAAAGLLALAGCGSTEQSGSVGEKLSAKGLRVTVERVDRNVPLPDHDVTGLSLPAQGFTLIGVRVRVCSNHGGAIGAYDFGMDTSGGGRARVKSPTQNYANAFDTVRKGCGRGWVVFEVPSGSTPTRVTFRFEDTGSAPMPQNQVNAKLSWKLE